MHLTIENYFSSEAENQYMGSTQFKRFMACETAALATVRGEHDPNPKPSKALLVGSYVDAHFSNTLDIFMAQHPEIFKRDGSLKTDFEYANYIIARIERDKAFADAMMGKTQVIMTGEIEGVPVKIRIDSLLPDRTVDMKIMRDFNPVYAGRDEGWAPFWKHWGYHYQGAIYQEIRRQNDGGQRKPFGIAAATKEEPEPDIALFELPQSELSAALDEVRANIVYFDSLKRGLCEPDRCERCAWCRATKELRGWVAV